jgi:alpha-glucosidase
MLRASAALLLLSTSAAEAGWSTFSAERVEREGATLVLRGAGAVASVGALTPEVVRVRFVPRAAFGRDHSYAVLPQARGPVEAAVESGTGRSVLRTAALTVSVQHAPFRVSFAAADGQSLDEDDAERGTSWVGEAARVWKRLRHDEHVYGLGEKTGRLDKRGWQLGGYAYAMWNSDTYAYDDGTDPLYASVPFYLVLRGGRAHGVFLDETRRSFFDVGKESTHLLSFGVEGGELDYYFIDGPTPRQVIERYTALTGRMPLPPRWALGYHQCRYSYYPEARVRRLADTFRARRVPGDAIWLDIHYLDGYAPFTWDRERFPDPARLLADLRGQGFRVVTIVDPHPEKARGSPVYETGLAGDHFVKNPDGTVYEAPVWPANAERDPGPSVFPDFSKPAARDWWGGLYRDLLEAGVAGIWNDMNEPAVFRGPTWTMPLDLRHDNEGEPSDHRAVHNVYGMLMTRATHEGLLRLRPDERPFVLTRATFAGGQRWAAVWPGDNVSDWSHLRSSIRMLAGLGLSGFPFVGTDIGGFAETATAELFTRWLQMGVFFPFMRAHTTFGTPDQEPWSYGPRHEEVNRRAVELRYELLPHLYDVMKEASDTGLPALRPLFLEFPQDPRAWSLEDAFLLGKDLLVAPVLREAATERQVYLPAGSWYELQSGRRHEGGRDLAVPVTLESLPVFVREGAFLFRQPVVPHTGAMEGQPLIVAVYPAARSEAWHYEDDGLTLAHLRGQSVRRRFAQDRSAAGTTVTVGPAEGPYRPAARDLELRVRLEAPPAAVSLDGRPLPRDAWSWTDEGWLTLRVPDRFVPLTLVASAGRR